MLNRLPRLRVVGRDGAYRCSPKGEREFRKSHRSALAVPVPNPGEVVAGGPYGLAEQAGHESRPWAARGLTAFPSWVLTPAPVGIPPPIIHRVQVRDLNGLT